MLETIRKYIWVIVAVVVVALIFSVLRSCDLSDRYSELVGEYDALAKKSAVEETKLLSEVVRLTSDIAERDREIALLTETIVVNTGVMDAHGITIEELEAALANIPTTEYASIITNLETQVTIWKERFTLAEGIISDKDAIIFSLTAKYDAQLKISGDYKTLWENEKELHSIALSRVKVLEGKLRVSRLGGTLKNLVVLGLGGVIIYGVVTRQER